MLGYAWTVLTEGMNIMSKNGLFIVLDGNDGSGKATQSKLLIERLTQEGQPCLHLDFPGYERNFFGGFLGECLAGHHGDFVSLHPKIASSIYALDRLESAREIRTALQDGMLVVADRFSSSNQIHQGGKIEDEQERIAFLEWLDRMEHDILLIPRPDAVVYLKVPLETSLRLLSEKRAQKNEHLGSLGRDTVEEDRSYLARSHEAAGWLATRQEGWHLVSCAEEDGRMRTIDSIHEDIVALVRGLMST